MPIQSGATAALYYKKETTSGTPEVAGFIEGRFTERAAPNLEVGELTSNEVTTRRQETSVRSGFQQVTGSLGYELSYRSQDDIIELATNEVFVPHINGTAHSIELTVAGTSTIEYTHATTLYTFVFDAPVTANKLIAGDVFHASIETTNLAAIGGFFVVVAITPTTSDPNLSADSLTARLLSRTSGAVPTANAAAADPTADQTLDFGECSFVSATTLATATIVRQFPDFATDLLQVFSGVTVGQMNLSASTDSLVSGTFELLGAGASRLATSAEIQTDGFTSADIGNAIDNPTANPGAGNTSYSPFTASVSLAGTGSAVVSGFEMSLNNQRSNLPLIGSPFSTGVYEGIAAVSGSATVLFESATEYNYFAEETEVPMSIVFRDSSLGTTNWMSVVIPRCRFTQPNMEIPQNGPVVLNLSFRGLEPTGGHQGSCHFQRYDAAPVNWV